MASLNFSRSTSRAAISGCCYTDRSHARGPSSRSPPDGFVGARRQNPAAKMSSPTKCSKKSSVSKSSRPSSTVEYVLMIAMLGTLTYPIFNKYIGLFVVSDSVWIQMLFLSQVYFLGLWAFYILHFGFGATINISLDSLLGISKRRKPRKGRRLFARSKKARKGSSLPLKIS